MFNWARNLNRKVTGVSRPEVNVVLDKGFYNVTIGFPSLGVAKDVRRVPLGPTLSLRFSRSVLEEILPSVGVLRLAAAQGLDSDGNLVFASPPASP